MLKQCAYFQMITIQPAFSKLSWFCLNFVCLMASGPEDNVADYYQQQVEMLEGFNEMDALAERGFVPRISKVFIEFCYLSLF